MTKRVQHKHIIIRAEVINPFGPEDLVWASEWFSTLIDNLGMKALNGPHVSYVNVPGNRGLTGTCIIETSHIAMHIWDESTPALVELDVYTCGELDKEIVFKHLMSMLPQTVDYMVLDRENDLKILESGKYIVEGDNWLDLKTSNSGTS